MKWTRLTYRAVSRSPVRMGSTCLVLLAYVVVVVDALLPGGALGAARLWVGLGGTFFILFFVSAWVREEESRSRDEGDQS